MKTVYTGEKDARSFKDVLGGTIVWLLDNDPDVIYLDADLMRCIGTYDYFKKHPDRAVNCGVAEANMAGVAAGLSAAGFKPIAHTFGPFASRRCFDQVFLSAGYGDNPITMIGSDPGVCAAFNGGTHMPFEDMALYRAISGATVMDVTDAAMLEDVLKQSVNRPGVKYIRVGRKNNARMYAEGSRFEIGRAIELGTDVTLIACGVMVHEAMQAANALAQMGIDAGVVDMFTVKPLDEETVERCARETGAIVTCENHNRIGGLTDAVAQTLALRCPVPLEHVAVEDEFGEVGPQDYLQKALWPDGKSHYSQSQKGSIPQEIRYDSARRSAKGVPAGKR